jgi:hypothetical protein
MTMPAAARLAILIDAENVSSACWPAALAIAGRFGVATVMRAYVCHPPAPGWVAAEGVEIVDGRPADGPNAADFLMAMDAAVMAAERRVDGFVLLTCDDGFAAVALGLKRGGATVYSLIPFNGGAIPRRLAAIADLTVLVPLPSAFVPAVQGSLLSIEDRWVNQLRTLLARRSADDEGWVELSELGSELKNSGIKKPKGKLSDIVRRVDGIEWRGTNAKAWLRLRGDVSALAPLAEPSPARDFGEFEFDDDVPC